MVKLLCVRERAPARFRDRRTVARARPPGYRAVGPFNNEKNKKYISRRTTYETERFSH